MTSRTSPEDPQKEPTCVAIGADAGGTKLALAFSLGTRVRYHRAPSVNLRTVSPKRFAALLAGEISSFLKEVPLDPHVTMCIGASGAGTTTVAEACRTELAALLAIPTERIVVTSDARIALEAAFPSGPGMLIIAGTGSGCFGLDGEGNMIRAGGWGPGLEDPGSGGELGRSAIKHVLTEIEGRDVDAFSRQVLAAMGIQRRSIPSVLDTYYSTEFNAASLAPVIMNGFEAEDPTAVALVRAQCATLAEQCARLARKMDQSGLDRIAVTGGLAKRESYVQALTEALQRVLPGARVSAIGRAPVEGALSLALSMADQHGDERLS